MDIRSEFADLVELDAARDVSTDPATHTARIDSILHADEPGAVAELPRPRRTGRRLVMLVAAAAVLAVIGTGVSALVGNESTGPLSPARAYGAWRPQAKALTATKQSNAVKECEAIGADGTGTDAFTATRTLITESRGQWVTVILGDAKGRIQSCLMRPGSDSASSSPEDPSVGLAASGIDFRAGYGQLANGKGNLPITAEYGYVGNDVAAVTLNVSSGLRVHATVNGGVYAASYPEAGNHRVTYTLRLKDGTTVERDELGHLAGTTLHSDVAMQAAQRLPKSLRKADRQCRRDHDIPAGDTSAYHAGTPWYAYTSDSDSPILFYVTDNGRQAWCLGGCGGWGPMVDVPAGSIRWIGGDGGTQFALVGRDVPSVSVHLRNGKTVHAKLHDSIVSYPGSDDVAYYVVTRADGTTVRTDS